MQLFVKGETLHAVSVTGNETVDELKGILAPLESIPIEEQVLSYGGVVLENEGLVSELVLPGGTLELTGRLLGGKFDYLHILRRKCSKCFRLREQFFFCYPPFLLKVI